MLQLKSFCFNPFQENTYVISNESGECVVIDPGCYEDFEKQELAEYIGNIGLKPQAVWLTHCHIDHVLGLQFCIEKWNLPFYLNQPEVAQLRAVEVYGPNYGFFDLQLPAKEGILFSGDRLQLGNEQFRILQVPGHSPGHVAFLHTESHRVWAGDVLFRQSIGRTDLPGGDFTTLKQSILEKLYTLPDQTEVFPGHGPTTTVGFEKQMNPYVNVR